MRLLPEEASFFFWAAAQLEPGCRPVFAERVAAILGAHPDPGPGDVDRAVRAALIGPDALAQQCADRDRITGLGNVPVAALLLESRPDGALYLLTTLSFERRAMH
jgi:hypothetical protein